MQTNTNQPTTKTSTIKRRPKRKPIDIQKALFTAITQIISEQGFPHLNIQNVAQKATVSKDIIYRYYQKFDNLLEKYFEQYDFWLTFAHSIATRYSSYEDFFKGILNELYAIMDQNKEFQCIIRWEVAAPNNFVVAKAQWREKFCQDMLEENEKYYAPYGIDIKTLYAIFISGIYYLILRKDISTFCDIDFSSNQGKERMKQSIEFIGNLLNEYIQRKHQEDHYKLIIHNLLKKNLSYKEIGEIMQFTPQKVKKLAQSSCS